MNRAILSTLMIAGLAMPGFSAQPQPQPETPKGNPEAHMFVYSAAGRSYLGVDIQDITADRVGPLKLKEERGVEITMVDADAPAGKAGLKEHDVILDFNGTKVESEEQLRRLIRETPPGRTVTLGISRDGNPMQVTLQLADHGKLWAEVGHGPKTITIPDFSNFQVDVPQIQVRSYTPTLGIQTENLTRQLGEFFGVKDGEGVLVRSVEKGSAAEKAGLKAGDVIVRAGDQKVSGRSDLSQVLRGRRQGGKLPLGIVREKREQTLTVDLPQRGKDSSFTPVMLQSSLGDISELMEDLGPEIEDAQQEAMLGLQSQMEAMRSDFSRSQTEWSAQAQKAMRDAQSELQKNRENLRKQQRELKKYLQEMRPMI